MGVDSTPTPCVEVEIWRESFLSLLQNGSSLQAIGAIGLGTESVVKFIYKHIIEAIKKHTSLSLQQYVFFPLHTELEFRLKNQTVKSSLIIRTHKKKT